MTSIGLGEAVTSGLLERWREYVIDLASAPTFVHHAWYVDYHLRIVERISAELCEIYPDADRAMVVVLVWLHDYGKIVGGDNTTTLRAGRNALVELGFPAGVAQTAADYAAIIDRRDGPARSATPIEVKIVSSADGCAHFVGPFFAIWWRDHPELAIEELRAENYRKALIDWSRKIVLPVAHARFARSFAVMEEQFGAIPDRFFSGHADDT